MAYSYCAFLRTCGLHMRVAANFDSDFGKGLSGTDLFATR